jgi:hypothetical protein
MSAKPTSVVISSSIQCILAKKAIKVIIFAGQKCLYNYYELQWIDIDVNNLSKHPYRD